jgi:hypothetical protein
MPVTWPPGDFARYIAKASAALEGHPHRKALSYRFASLLEHGTAAPVPHCPSKACRCRDFPGLGEWVALHTREQLRAHIATADDAVFAARLAKAERLRNWIVRLVGWRRRRGDIMVMRVRRSTWVGMRNK